VFEIPLVKFLKDFILIWALTICLGYSKADLNANALKRMPFSSSSLQDQGLELRCNLLKKTVDRYFFPIWFHAVPFHFILPSNYFNHLTTVYLLTFLLY
jgi:hypothetical protein